MSSFIHCISYNATSFSKCSSPVNGVIHGQHEQYLVTFIAPAKTHTMKVMRQSCKQVLNKLPLPKWQQGIRSSTCRRSHISFFSTVHLASTAEIEEGSRECRSCCTTDSLPVGQLATGSWQQGLQLVQIKMIYTMLNFFKLMIQIKRKAKETKCSHIILIILKNLTIVYRLSSNIKKLKQL